MNVRLSPALSRGLALAVLAGLLGAIYVAVAMPLIADYASTRREIAERRAAFARFEQIAGERASRQARLAALETRRAAQEGFLQGSNDTLIAAEIQNRVKTLVASGQGALTSTQILPSEAEGKLKRVSVRGQIAITLPGLVRVFHALEAANPFLFVDNVDIRPRPDPQRRVADPTDTSVLEVRFDVFGYVRAAD